MLKSDLKILLADDHPLMLDGLHAGLTRLGYHCVVLARDGQEAFNFITREKIDLIILDIEMPKKNGFEIVEYLLKNELKIPTIFLSYHKENRYLALAKKLGVKGYLLKEDGIQTLHHCIQSVIKGESYYSKGIENKIKYEISEELRSISELTKSERIILKCVCKGLSSSEIAQKLNISKRTVQNHRSNISQKLKEDLNAMELREWAVENRLLIERL